MTLLHNPATDTFFTDQAIFPINFADGQARDVFADHHTLVAGLSALHHHEAGICPECAVPWPCKTVRLVRNVAVTVSLQ